VTSIVHELFVDCWRYPKNFASVEYNHIGLIRDLVLAIGTVAKTIGKMVTGSQLLYGKLALEHREV
jgi:hypothetical protein